MSALVPMERTEPTVLDVTIGEPVRGKTWRELALLMHWCRAHGMHLIPAHNPSVFISSTVTTRTLSYRVEPEGHAIARIWAINMRQTEPTASAAGMKINVQFPNGNTVNWNPDVVTGVGAPGQRVYFETLPAKSSGLQTLDITFAHTSGDGYCYVESVTCFEVPRAVLSLDAADGGVDLEGIRPGQPIYYDQGISLGAVVENLSTTWPRRMLWQQATLLTISATSWTDLFVLPAPILPHKRGRSDTTAAVAWDVRAYTTVDGTTTGEIRITTGRSSNTDTLTLAAGSTAEAWLGPGEVTADCEVVTASDGLPGSNVFETVQIAVRRTAGSGNIVVTSVAAWEADPLPHFRITTDGSFREDDVSDFRITAD